MIAAIRSNGTLKRSCSTNATRSAGHGGLPGSSEAENWEAREWERTLPLIAEPAAADTVLLGVPMYNFAVSAALKAWIDRVTFPGAFTHPDTGESLLSATRVVAVLARGGAYGPETGRADLDFQLPYLTAWTARLGVRPEHLHPVAAELTRVDVLPFPAGQEEAAAAPPRRARTALCRLAAVA
ncbi:NAD(P)H-dependent oxidoreductase [Streptomyces sp. NPDC094038]|uniref:NAD(P)H-dependent oxidoreductase n=1 Tax=Streptomyces sp. NPDC094038 TaxID=3366055 RepID=UPI003801CBA7